MHRRRAWVNEDEVKRSDARQREVEGLELAEIAARKDDASKIN